MWGWLYPSVLEEFIASGIIYSKCTSKWLRFYFSTQLDEWDIVWKGAIRIKRVKGLLTYSGQSNIEMEVWKDSIGRKCEPTGTSAYKASGKLMEAGLVLFNSVRYSTKIIAFIYIIANDGAKLYIHLFLLVLIAALEKNCKSEHHQLLHCWQAKINNCQPSILINNYGFSS